MSASSLNTADRSTRATKGSLPATEEWLVHEHVSPSVQSQAQKLLEEAGSSGLAKQAIDLAEQEQACEVGVIGFRVTEILRFPKPYLRIENSVPVPSEYSMQWWVTALSNGHWVAWNEESGDVSGEFDSREAAVRFVAQQDLNYQVSHD